MNLPDMLEMLLLVGAYLALGFIVRCVKYPGGIFAREPDAERERLVRTGRRRVLPLPPGQDP